MRALVEVRQGGLGEKHRATQVDVVGLGPGLGGERAERLGPRFDLVLYNAGMDPYEGCAVGGLDGITAEILAGGYIGERLDAETLVDLHRSTIAAAAESVARQFR